MKRFVTTIAGKTILFLLCILSACVLAASLFGIYVYAESSVDFYLNSEEALQQRLTTDTVRSDGYDIVYNELVDYFNTNHEDYSYRLYDGSGKLLAEVGTMDTVDYTLTYGVVQDTEGYIIDTYYYYPGSAPMEGAEYYTVQLTANAGSQAAKELNLLRTLLHLAYVLRFAVYPIAVVSFLLALGCFVALMYAAGRRAGEEGFFPGPAEIIPYDVLLAASCLLGLVLIYITDSLGFRSWLRIGITLAVCLIGLNVGLGLCISAASRIKRHTLLRNMLCYRICRLLWGWVKKLWSLALTLLRSLPLIWKTAVAVGGICLLELLGIAAVGHDWDALVSLWVIEKAILVPLALYLALTLRRLQKGGAALAAGDLAYHTDTKAMLWDFKQHGENLNSIAAGMSIAVEDRLKSERMKTELITNVSHDIKTPLTSIINYADLIGREPCDNPVISEYSEVLVRQSGKLKRLIEDLVEASKASTGNLEVCLAPCDASVFLSQASGEYEDKLRSADLTLITKQPERELMILADGRRMWRVFDNLMNNICKYAQPGTRVYLSLEEQAGNAVITFKNTSREALDMTEEELMERFTRGDSSRSTEGNGLGLSIAGSMAELQGGSLNLTIDGDLFKATLTFPLQQ